MNHLYTFDDYKTFFKAFVKSRASEWGILTRMAEATGCQRAYMSRCLNQEVHLTMDHAFHLSKFLDLDVIEVDYFMTLVELSRAATKPYRDRLDQKLAKIRKDDEELKKSAARPPTDLNGGEAFYYSTWLPAVIHILTSIPEFQSATAISEKLNIDRKTAEKTLLQLEALKLISRKASKWIFNSSEMHLSKNSPLSPTHLNNWRQRAVLNAQLNNDESIHYSVIQSLDEKAYIEIRKAVVKIIGDFSKHAGPAPANEVACFNIDIFKI